MSEIYKKFLEKKLIQRKETLAYYSGNVDKTNAALRWLIDSGKGQRIKTALYYIKQPNEWYKENVVINPWLIASRAVENGVIAFHSAFRLWAEAYSESRYFQIAVSKEFVRAPKKFEYQGAQYQFFREDLTFGLAEQVVDDLKIRIFSKERLILEGLMHPDRFLGMSEFLKSIDNINWLDLQALMSMLSNYAIPTLSMRLGWLLEKYSEKWYVQNTILEKLYKNRPEDRVFLISKNRQANFLVKKWNLMVPQKIQDQTE